ERTALRVVRDLDRLEEWRSARLAMTAGVIDRALGPPDRRKIHAVLIGKVTPDPHRRRHRVERDADPLTLDVFRGADAGPAVHIDVTVAEDSRRKHWQRHEGAIASVEATDELRARELRRAEFLPAAHPVEQIARRRNRQEFEIDVLELHVAGAK